MVFVFADESEILLIVLPCLAREADIGDMHESFAAGFIELHKEAEFGDS